MKLKLQISIVVFLFQVLASTSLGAPLLLVSDIDDTLKVSSVRDSAVYTKSFDTKTQFSGMSELYGFMSVAQKEKLHIAYVTAAPTKILGVPLMKNNHQKFLQNNQFPAGSFYTRDSLSDQEYKFLTIRKLVREQSPAHVILIGDNGGRDAEIYQVLQNEMLAQGITSSIFIHRIYPDLAVGPENYFSYITSIELARQLQIDGFISEANYLAVLNKVMPVVEQNHAGVRPKGASQVFPTFLNCADFRWSLPSTVELARLEFIVNQACGPGR